MDRTAIIIAAIEDKVGVQFGRITRKEAINSHFRLLQIAQFRLGAGTSAFYEVAGKLEAIYETVEA